MPRRLRGGGWEMNRSTYNVEHMSGKTGQNERRKTPTRCFTIQLSIQNVQTFSHILLRARVTTRRFGGQVLVLRGGSEPPESVVFITIQSAHHDLVTYKGERISSNINIQ